MIARETPGLYFLQSEQDAQQQRAEQRRAVDSDDSSFVERVLRSVVAGIEQRDTLLSELQARLPDVPTDRPVDRETERTIADLHADIALVHRGVRVEDGPSYPPLEQLRGLPGRDELLRLRTRLEARLAHLHVKANTTWPRAFRYTGGRFKHMDGGRYVEPGEVCQLTEQQAGAWRDRFEPVQES